MHPELPFGEIDQVISAEIPTETADPELYSIIMRFNWHPENHLDSSRGHCSRKGTCRSGFPKRLQNTTTLDNHGRVQYQRRNERDSWVVSYMPFLSQLLNCHVNVDICFTVNIFMYLYKYLFKGPDRTFFTMSAEDEVDEIQDYIDARYLSASEAAWRILEYNITRKEPAVKSLSIHLPCQQLSQMYRRNGSQSTASTLLRYFARPSIEIFSQLTYTQYYEKYCLYSYSGKEIRESDFLEEFIVGFPQFIVRQRSKGEVIARIQTISPRHGELFYIRALLLHKAARSFEELRTIQGIVSETFQEAAAALGLFANASEAEEALQEAVKSYSSPREIRFLFCHLLLNIPTRAVLLFDQFLEELSADYLDQFENPLTATDYCLTNLAKLLTAQGSRLSDFGLPEPNLRCSELILDQEAFAQRHEDLFWQYSENEYKLLSEQQQAYFEIIEALYCNNPRETCFFLEGKAGRKKSFTASVIVDRMRSEGRTVVVVGSTALSVILYERGRTAHATFGILVIEV